MDGLFVPGNGGTMSKRSNIKNDRTKTKRADVKCSSVSRFVKKDTFRKTGTVKKPKKRFIDYFLKDEADIEPKNHGKHRQKKQKNEISKSSGTVKTRPQKKSINLKAVKKIVAAVILKFRSIKKAYLRAKKNTGTSARKRKLYLSYVGAGTVVIAVTLIFILAPIGKAKDTDVKAANEDTTSAYIALSLLDPEPSPTPIRTTLPEMTRPEAPNTPNVTETDNNTVGNGTTEQTPAPTAKPTPIPTTTPAPTPKPTPEPTPKPTPKPTPEPTPEPTPTPKPTPKYDIDELAQSYKVVADEYYNKMGFSPNYYEYTDEELTILARVIHRESKGESLSGKIAVGNVVMNRVLNLQRFGNTIKAVVVDSGQFAYSADTIPSPECIKAARLVLDDQKWVVPQHIYFFKNSGGDWGSHTLWKQIGNHYFYAHNYSGRNTNGEIPPELFKRTFEWPRYGCEPSKDVWRIQSMLAYLKYDVSPDKYFGKGTEEAMEKFQKDVGIKADGVAGPTTIAKLINKYGLDKYIADFME